MRLVALVAALATAWAQAPSLQFGDWANTEVYETLDLVKSYTRRQSQISAQNRGSESIDAYYVPVSGADADHLSVMEATMNGNPVEITLRGELELPELIHEAEDAAAFAVYRIQLPTDVAPSDTIDLQITQIFSRSVTPLPKRARQTDSQMMLYTGPRVMPSLYLTEKQTLAVSTLTPNVKELNGLQLTIEGGEQVLPSVENAPALDTAKVSIHYEAPLPQSHVLQLQRTIWVSHWGGSISTDESYDVINAGTQLSKPFSRLDFSAYQAGFSLNSAAIRGFPLRVPAQSAREHYYVDLVGNVSTSAVRQGVLEVMPRYPIMGGWAYNFTVGWASDLQEYVRQPSSGSYILAVPILSGFEGVSYDKVVNTIVLPEGATEIDVFDKFSAGLETSITYNYLDLYGRPTLTLAYSNLVDAHGAAHIYVSYKYSLITALRKPLSYAVLLFAGFMGAAYFFRSKN